jgi:hypothetical protein
MADAYLIDRLSPVGPLIHSHLRSKSCSAEVKIGWELPLPEAGIMNVEFDGRELGSLKVYTSAVQSKSAHVEELAREYTDVPTF